MTASGPAFADDAPELPAEAGAILGAVEAMSAALDGVRARLLAGEPVSLVGLDQRMAGLYAAVAGISRDGEAASRLLGPLEALAEGLERLDKALRLRGAMPGPSAPPRKAAGAYGAAVSARPLPPNPKSP